MAGTLIREVVEVEHAMTDRELLPAYIETGAEAIFSKIVSRHQAMVYSTCLRVLGDVTAAEDAAQAVFLILHRKRKTLSSSVVLSGWLFRTARFTAMESRKKRTQKWRWR